MDRELIVAHPKGLERFLLHYKLSQDCLNTPGEMLKLYGDIVTINDQLFYVGDPALAERIMVEHETFGKDAAYGYSNTAELFWGSAMQVSNGAEWAEKRRLIQSALEPGRVTAYGRTMVQHTLDRISDWQDGTRLDLHQWLGRLTLELTIQNILGVKLPDTKVDVIEEALQATLDLFGDLNDVPVDNSNPNRRQFEESLQALDDIVYEVIEQRRASGEDRGDLLSILLQAPLSDKALRDEITTFLRAGHRNSATLLTWSFAEIARHPAVEKQLATEIGQVLGGNPPGVEHLAQLAFTEQIIYEAARLYPLYPFIVRTVKKPVELAGHSFRVGAKFGVNAWMLHRSEQYFHNPDQFDPSRWQRDEKPPRFTFLPFGGGARHCPFKSYGLMEAVLVLATIAQRYSVQLEHGERALISYTKNGLLPKGGLHVVVKQVPDLR